MSARRRNSYREPCFGGATEASDNRRKGAKIICVRACHERCPVKSAPPRLDTTKLGLIHVAKKQLALSEEDYREILDAAAGVKSARELTPGGFEAVMSHFELLGFKSTSASRGYGQRRNMATPAQVHAIRQGWAAYTGGEGTEAQLNAWLHAKFGISALRFLDRWTVGKALHALRCMNRRRSAPETGSPVAPVSQPAERP